MVRHSVFRSIFLVLLLSLCSLGAEVQIKRGTIEGAHFTIAFDSSENWNRGLLLIAHGYRPEAAPLVADFFPEQSAYAQLLREGWIIAKTSYRRNGIIIDDAITDLDNLHRHVSEQFGTPARSIIEGDSMGGTIATLLVEREESQYDGAVAVGAALDLKETNGSNGVTLRPRRPLVFMANRSEILGPTAYFEATAALESTFTRPLLLRVDRDGHVNVNQAERLFAIRTLNQWLDQGRPTFSDELPIDATQNPPSRESEVAFDHDLRGLRAEVIHVSAIYGNVWLNIQKSDLAKIGWSPGLWAEVKVGEQSFRTRYGKDFSSVEKGQWVIFPNADGYFWLSRNWGNAAETASLEVGSSVHIRRYESVD